MTSKRWYAYPNNHTPRVFVEKVDFVTTLGSRCRENPGYGEGCRYVLSNLAILDFEEATGAMRLRHTMPGVTVAAGAGGDRVRAARSTTRSPRCRHRPTRSSTCSAW